MRFLVLLLTLSIAAPTDAAINMLGSADAKVSFGDVTMGGETAVTVAVTVLVAGAFVGAGDRFVSKWGNSSGEQSFVLYRPGNNNINFLVSNAANVYGCGTTDTPLSGTPLLVRIVATITLDPKTCRIWVNGAERTTANVFNDSPVTVQNTASSLEVGRETDESVDGVDGDYSELAVWVSAVPDWVAIAYGKGMSPRFYRTTMAICSPLLNTTTAGLLDTCAGTAGTNTSGTDAAHPTVYRQADGN
jgi:hypothetical protein